MSKFFKLFLILIAFSFSINSEAAKRGSFGSSHGWGKQSHSSPVKFKKNKKKNKYKAVSASAVAAAGLFSSSKGSVTEENNHIDKKSKIMITKKYLKKITGQTMSY